MDIRKTAIVAGLAGVLVTSTAFAQSYSPDYAQQQTPYGHQHRHHHGAIALIREEVHAGRISQREGALLEQKIKAMKAERKAERQGRYGQGSNNGDYYASPMQQPQR